MKDFTTASNAALKTGLLLLLVALAASIALTLLTSCGGSPVGEGRLQPPVTSESAEGENYKDIALQFEKAGFTNIRGEGLGDLITGWLHGEGDVKEVTIDGEKKYSREKQFDPDALVVIRYHSFTKEEGAIKTGLESSAADSSESNGSAAAAKKTEAAPEESSESSSPSSGSSNNAAKSVASPSDEQVLEQSFPKDAARRAATVALTNATASDVFASDGNSHDRSLYHNYSDRSGEYLELISDGAWKAKNETTWHVSGLKYVNSYGTELTASLDVSWDGSNYVVSNLSGTIGKPGIGTPLEEYEAYYDETWSYLTVSPDLLE